MGVLDQRLAAISALSEQACRDLTHLYTLTNPHIL